MAEEKAPPKGKKKKIYRCWFKVPHKVNDKVYLYEDYDPDYPVMIRQIQPTGGVKSIDLLEIIKAKCEAPMAMATMWARIEEVTVDVDEVIRK